ncbi:MAG: redox-sensing transcriptional repressor Rex [Elusimicrobiaceae bacterium]|nr:redox-sensing transcriptional repressor Rex [Elusimicrobiaceae bacterium]
MNRFSAKSAISKQTIRRLPQYLRVFYDLHAYGRSLVSSTDLAAETQLLPIVIKKDLQAVGAPTKLRAGFKVAGTIEAIENFLGWDNLNKAFLIGTGHLGSALLGFSGFQNHGLEIVAAFDTNPEKVGQEIHGVQVYHTAQLKSIIKAKKLKIAVLALPGSAAQGITDTLVECGVKAIWNFAPVKLSVPEDVAVQQEDIASGLAELCAKLKSN